MTFRSTFILLISALGLLAFIYFFDNQVPEESQKTVAESRILPDLDPTAIVLVEVARSNSVIRIQHTNDAWQLISPAYPAQAAGVELLIAASAKAARLARVSAREIQSESGGLRAFGLEPPRAALTFQSSTGRIHLNIGGATPVAGRIYVQRVGSPDVLVTDASLLKHVPETPDQWRDTRLIDLTALHFDSVQVQNGNRTFELLRNHTNQQWQIVRPLPGRADSNRVEELFVRLQNMRVQKFVTDIPLVDLDTFGLQTPVAALSFAFETNTLGTIEFGKSPTNDPAQVYARNPARSNIVTVARELLDFLQQPAKTFHDPHLLGLPLASVSSIQVRAAESFDIQKHEGKWLIEPGDLPADSFLVSALLTNAANLQIVDFAKDVPTETDLALYGLHPPKRQYTFLTSATNLAGLTTNVPIVEVDFGSQQLDIIYAKRSGEAPAYKTTAAAVDELPVQAFQVRDRRLWNASASSITNISFVFNDTTNHLVRGPDGHWSADEVFNAAIEEMVFRVAQVETPRWVARGRQKVGLFGLNISTSSLILDISDSTRPKKIVISFGRPTLGRPANVYAAYIPEAETEPLICEFPGAVYQDLVRLMTPNPR